MTLNTSSFSGITQESTLHKKRTMLPIVIFNIAALIIMAGFTIEYCTSEQSREVAMKGVLLFLCILLLVNSASILLYKDRENDLQIVSYVVILSDIREPSTSLSSIKKPTSSLLEADKTNIK